MALGNILIVDDEADVKGVIKRGLEIFDFSVTAECNPLEALSRFKAGAYDLALLDIRMPKMDGFELYEKMSRIDGKMKVCFLTAFDIDYFEKFEQRFPDIPTRCFIKKPVSIKDLIGMVRSELGYASEA